MTDRELVQYLCDIEEGLTDWEVRFVESISKHVLEQGESLSPTQRHKAEEIFDNN